MRTKLAAAALVVLAAFGCTKIIGLDYQYQGTGVGGGATTTTTTTTTTTGTTGTGGTPACGGFVWDPDVTCQGCMNSACCGELLACDKGTPCGVLTACIRACPQGDVNCETTCLNDDANKHMSSGLTAYDDLEACFGSKCDDTTHCYFPICTSGFGWTDRTCAKCLTDAPACCAAFTACAMDPVCEGCTQNPSGAGCAANMNYQTAYNCEIATCGAVCTYDICGSTIGYTASDCNYCVSQATGGCCMEFNMCIADMTSTCYKCISGTSTAGCNTDTLYAAYNTCVSANCSVACSGY